LTALVQPTSLGPLDNPREAREFRTAKERSGGEVCIALHGACQTSFQPHNREELKRYVVQLSKARSTQRLAEQIARLEREALNYGCHGMPLPTEVIVNSGGSMSWFWQGAAAIFDGDRIVWTIGGAEGLRGEGMSPDLCRCLAALRNMEITNEARTPTPGRSRAR
jgi:hypothetical protein